MIRSGRPPRTRDERMILNNYAAMRRVSELRDDELTVDMILEIHRIVTDGTLDDPADCGRLQESGEVRVAVYGPATDDDLFHTPPPAEELPERLQRLCAFANGEPIGSYVPSVVRANWSMLKQGFWLTEFLTISRILRKAPAKYAKSFLHGDHGPARVPATEDARCSRNPALAHVRVR
jgi:Fic family protein